MSPAARVSVKVVPKASADAIAGRVGEALKVRVRAAPERGRANEAACAVLAAALGVPASAVRVVAGHGSPRKVVEVDGLAEEEVLRRLGSASAPRPPA